MLYICDMDIDYLFKSPLTQSDKSSLSKEDFVAEITPLLQDILKKAFPNNAARQRIVVHKDRLSFAAPCCGDSASDNYKKRGNIILEGKFKNLYKCFNCGECMSIGRFLKRYGEIVPLNIIDYVNDNKFEVSSARGSSSEVLSALYDYDKIEELSVDRIMFRDLLGLTECTESCFGRDYLIKRCQYDFSKFMYSTVANKLFLLNLTPSGKIFGIQVRSFDGKGAKYKTYGLSKIHSFILRDNIEVPEELNELSMIFNVLLVDYSRYVTVTEGPMDSFLLKNAIALCGAGKNMEFPFMVRYMFDDDKTGREHSIEKLRDGYMVFMWDEYKKDIGLRSQRKIDYNDIYIYCNKNKIKMPVIDDYFSNDELDLISI